MESKTTGVVSVVIPCYNEERFIGKALESLAEQYDPGSYEIVIVDGMSNDGTRSVIASFARTRPQLSVRIIDNPLRTIPIGLNLGVKHAQGDIIARMDAHAVPSQGYIRRCVAVLEQAAVGVVGMPCYVLPGANTLTARAIACGVSHRFGIGDAKYRLRDGQLAQEQVDTVAFACFRKSLWSSLGGFNETLLTNEDYDFNYRVRESGLQVMLDRSGHCDYFARTTLKDLGRQYRRYGRWKAQMVKLHPRSLKVRHMMAPLFVLSIVSLAAAGFLWSFAWLVLGLELGLYLFLALAFGLQVARNTGGGLPLALMMPLVFLNIHVSWGTSFLTGLMIGPQTGELKT